MFNEATFLYSSEKMGLLLYFFSDENKHPEYITGCNLVSKNMDRNFLQSVHFKFKCK